VATPIRTLLRRNGFGPAPLGDGSSWTEFLRAQVEGILASDFLPVGTAFHQTLYVLFFIELGTRRVHVPSTRNPDAGYTTQQARNLYIAGELSNAVRFLIRDRDSKYTPPSTPCSDPRVQGLSSRPSVPRRPTCTPDAG